MSVPTHSEDFPIIGRHLQRTAQAGCVRQSGCCQRRLAGDVPNEARQFTGDGREHARLRLPCIRQMPVSFVETDLRFPAYVFDLLGQVR